MKKILLVLILSMYAVSSFAQEHYPESGYTYWQGQLLVMLQASCTADAFVKSVPVPGFKVVKNVSREWNIWLVSFDTAMDAQTAKQLVASNSNVKLVQFNHNSIPLKSVPNDTLFSNQWDMTIISAPQAWDLVTGGLTTDSQQVVVATIDAGFELNHPDISFWKNIAEIPNNGIDDDSDGYIDDYNGWNTVLNSDSIPVVNHGTFVAGISGALGNNITGVAGTCWNVKEMVVVTNENDESSVVSAYSYVFKQRQLYNQTHGAKGAFVVVTNSSFGPAGYGYDYPLWNAMYDSMGTLGILSAGATSNNASCNTDTCPDIPSQCASYYTIITTGTTSADVRHGGYGPHNVDIAAPGNGTYTTLQGATYGTCGGTSAASPHVAGAIALMWSAACPKMLDDYRNYPDSMALQMKQYLLESVDTLPALVGMIVSGGRLNVYKAVQKVQAYDCTIISPTAAPQVATIAPDVVAYPNPVTGILKIKSEYPVKQIEVYNFLGQMTGVYNNVAEVDMNGFANGIYTLRITDDRQHSYTRKITIVNK